MSEVMFAYLQVVFWYSQYLALLELLRLGWKNSNNEIGWCIFISLNSSINVCCINR